MLADPDPPIQDGITGGLRLACCLLHLVLVFITSHRITRVSSGTVCRLIVLACAGLLAAVRVDTVLHAKAKVGVSLLLIFASC